MKRLSTIDLINRAFNLKDFNEKYVKKNSPKSPSFVGIGLPKAGTSWLYHMILSHPRIQPNYFNLKELNYFIHFVHKDKLTDDQKKSYKLAFAREKNILSGEFSPGYAANPMNLYHLYDACGIVKIIFIYRNPSKRYFSQINYWNRNLDDYIKKPEYTKVAMEPPRALLYSFAFPALNLAINLFGKKNIFFTTYEILNKYPKETLDKLFEFLEIDRMPRYPLFSKRVNPSSRKLCIEPNNNLLIKYEEYYDVEKKWLRECFPEIDIDLSFNS